MTVRLGDGHEGWPEQAPFAAIVVTAAPATTPPALMDQLADGGRLIIPEGNSSEQYLDVYIRVGSSFTKERTWAVHFVPLVDPPK